MGKKAKSTKGAQRAQARKLDKASLPPPPKAVDDEVRIYMSWSFFLVNHMSMMAFLAVCVKLMMLVATRNNDSV